MNKPNLRDLILPQKFVMNTKQAMITKFAGHDHAGNVWTENVSVVEEKELSRWMDMLLENIAKLEAEAIELYAHYETDMPRYWGPRENGQFNDTHRTWIFPSLTQEIVKEPTKAELLELMREPMKHAEWADRVYKMADRIEQMKGPIA